jgi:hypothetical protein
MRCSWSSVDAQPRGSWGIPGSICLSGDRVKPTLRADPAIRGSSGYLSPVSSCHHSSLVTARPVREAGSLVPQTARDRCSTFGFFPKPALSTSYLLRPRIWPSFRASSGLEPCDVLNKYASGPSLAVPRDGCPVARPSPRSRCGVSCIMRARGEAALEVCPRHGVIWIANRCESSSIRTS